MNRLDHPWIFETIGLFHFSRFGSSCATIITTFRYICMEILFFCFVKCHWAMSLKVPCLKMHFWISDLARAVALFSKNVHDESLPTSIQTMSCKLLLNLVECIKDRSHKENAITNGRELLMRMNEVFVQKFKTVAKLQLVSDLKFEKTVQFKETALFLP